MTSLPLLITSLAVFAITLPALTRTILDGAGFSSRYVFLVHFIPNPAKHHFPIVFPLFLTIGNRGIVVFLYLRYQLSATRIGVFPWRNSLRP